jgi:hypothetical protein
MTNGVQQGRVLHLKPGLNRIGRSADNHFQVTEPSVSTNHCEVVLSDANVLVRDLGSTNGTFVDGEPVEEAILEPGHTLQLGNLELRLEAPDEVAAAAGIHVPEPTAGATAAAATLPDGSPACANHPEVPAEYRCTKCTQTICGSCVRVIRRLGGDSMMFCSLCAGLCESLYAGVAAEPEPVAPEKPSLLGRLAQTWKLTFKGRR